MNFIPLIDVMLVLLIIFMAATPVVNSNIFVDIPKVAATGQQGEESVPDTLIISLNQENDIYISSPYLGIMDKPSEITKLPVFVAALMKERPTTKVFLRSDGRLPYAEVANVMNTLKLSGADRINLVTERVFIK